MPETSTSDEHILLIGHGSKDSDGVAEYELFAQTLARRLGRPVQPCFLEFADPPIAAGLESCVAAGARRVVALPLFLGPAGHQKNDVPAILNWAKARWPQVQFSYGAPLGTQYPIVETLAARAQQALDDSRADVALEQTALVIVARGSRDPDSNSDVAKLARLLWEGRGYGWAEPAYYSLTPPDVQQAIARCIALGARRVVVLPYLLFTGRIARNIAEQALALRERHPGVELLVAPHLGDHSGIVEAVAQRYADVLAGTATMTCDLCKYRRPIAGFEQEHGLPQSSDHNHGMRGIHSHGTLELLPPRYRDGRAVSAAPMGAAPLVYDAEGRVAWDAIWTGFCELALAGGPPHRGSLLEPVPPDAVAADRAGYARVLDEIERGIQMVTGLEVLRDAAPGWVGVRCSGEEMALWLLRAIVVENVCVRREGATLFLPAGPGFRLEYEIKNVITALAKTHHYWTEHLQAAQEGRTAP